MELLFSCPACHQSLTMDSELAGSQVSCPACGQAFIVAGAPTVLPVVPADNSRPAPPPVPPAVSAPAPRKPAPPRGPQRPSAGRPGFSPPSSRHAASSASHEETKAKVLLAAIFIGGFAILAGLVYGGVLYLRNVKDEPILSQQIVDLEKHRAAEAEAKLRQAQQEERALAAQKRTQLRNFLSLNFCEGRDDVAEELLKEIENAQAQLAKEADAGHMPDDPLEYLQRHLVIQITQNTILRQWFGSHSQKTFLTSIFGPRPAPGPNSGPVQGPIPNFLAQGNYASMGTGFFISSHGLLLTNHHVVGTRSEVDVRFPDGQIKKVRVLESDAKLDIALLKAAYTPEAFLGISDKDTTMGASVFTIGFPRPTVQGISPKFTDGKVSSLSGIRDDPTRYQISVPVQPGNSGGPLVSLQTGGVIGMVSARLAGANDSSLLPENVNYAIKGSVILDFLKKSAEWSGAADPVENADANTMIDRVKSATVLILVAR